MLLRDQIIAEARTWLRTPFRHQGRVKGVGVDCAGLVVMVGQSLGLLTYDTREYGVIPNPRRMKGLLDQYLVPIQLGEFKPGDVVYMAFKQFPVHPPMHLAIVTDVGIIHAFATNKIVVEHSLDAEWRGRFRNAYSYPGVN